MARRSAGKMLVERNEIPNQVFQEYVRMSKVFYNTKKWFEMPEQELYQELCLCILSSNVPYELAQSAFLHLLEKGYLCLEWVANTPESARVIAHELSRPLYLPRKLDGSRRKYRFYNTRARNIVQAAKAISTENGWLLRLLTDSTSENEVREHLVRGVPGVGLKQASHFMRNVGYSNRLAIVDSHVVSFLRELEIVERETRPITHKLYLELESCLQQICDENQLNLSVFDMAIWHYMRRKRQ